MGKPGLRERKKLRTRDTIINEATKLFEAKGFVETSIEDIAEAAEVAPRTFYRYFETKEDVLFSSADAGIEAAAAMLASSDPQEDDLAVLERTMRTLTVGYERSFGGPSPSLTSRLLEAPSIQARRLELRRKGLQQLVEAMVARRPRAMEDEVRIRVICNSLFAGLTTYFDNEIETGKFVTFEEGFCNTLAILREGFSAIKSDKVRSG